jgi:ubiquitin carboxyl-terminal hydrolase 4/11
VTSAAYLLFYRRRSPPILGGPFVEKIVQEAGAKEAEDNPTQPSSRTESPAGEGQRLDGFSRNGSSSAYQGAGADHQAGDGGLAGRTLNNRTGAEDKGVHGNHDPEFEIMDSMETDETDELAQQGPIGFYPTPTWAFGPISNNDDDNNSMKSASSTGANADDDDRSSSSAGSHQPWGGEGSPVGQEMSLDDRVPMLQGNVPEDDSAVDIRLDDEDDPQRRPD